MNRRLAAAYRREDYFFQRTMRNDGIPLEKTRPIDSLLKRMLIALVVVSIVAISLIVALS